MSGTIFFIAIFFLSLFSLETPKMLKHRITKIMI